MCKLHNMLVAFTQRLSFLISTSTCLQSTHSLILAILPRHREGKRVIEDGRIRFLLSSRQLEIQDTRIEDTAEYTCVATNVAGEASLKYKLNVWGELVVPVSVLLIVEFSIVLIIKISIITSEISFL